MQNENLTFNDLPQVVAQLRDEVMGMRAMLTRQQAESSKPVKENRHKPMTVDEAIEYTHIPRGTMYMKLEDGTIPASLATGRTTSTRNTDIATSMVAACNISPHMDSTSRVARST